MREKEGKVRADCSIIIKSQKYLEKAEIKLKFVQKEKTIDKPRWSKLVKKEWKERKKGQTVHYFYGTAKGSKEELATTSRHLKQVMALLLIEINKRSLNQSQILPSRNNYISKCAVKIASNLIYMEIVMA